VEEAAEVGVLVAVAALVDRSITTVPPPRCVDISVTTEPPEPESAADVVAAAVDPVLPRVLELLVVVTSAVVSTEVVGVVTY
jgi:hypothetical protein